MTTKLDLFNSALRLCKQRKLASLSDNSEARRLLDDAWGDGQTTGAVKYCLELGQWSFAMRTAMVDYSPSVEPDFGYRYAFDQPADLVRIAAVCQDEFFKVPLLEYTDERGYWYASIPTIYVRWVSNDPDYGADLSLWPESFGKVVSAYLAMEIVGNLTQGENEKLVAAKAFKEAVRLAKGKDGMNNPTRYAPQGSWSRARYGGSSWRGDRSA